MARIAIQPGFEVPKKMRNEFSQIAALAEVPMPTFLSNLFRYYLDDKDFRFRVFEMADRIMVHGFEAGKGRRRIIEAYRPVAQYYRDYPRTRPIRYETAALVYLFLTDPDVVRTIVTEYPLGRKGS